MRFLLMASVPRARFLLCADTPAAVDDVRQLLQQAGHAPVCHALDGTEPNDLLAYDLVVLDGSRQPQVALEECRRLRARLGETPVPILFLLADPAPAARQA